MRNAPFGTQNLIFRVRKGSIFNPRGSSPCRMQASIDVVPLGDPASSLQFLGCLSSPMLGNRMNREQKGKGCPRIRDSLNIMNIMRQMRQVGSGVQTASSLFLVATFIRIHYS